MNMLKVIEASTAPHLEPGEPQDEREPTTQRALELHMRGKWAERLLAHFAPFAEHIAYMQDILGEDFRKEALDLLGDSRFRTLRQHCLVYESLRKRGFTVIPWQERHVRSLLNQLADEEVTPCKLRQVWNTLKWFSKTFGLLKIDELHRLKSKKSSLEEALTGHSVRRWSLARRSFGLWRRGPVTIACHRPRHAGGPGQEQTRAFPGLQCRHFRSSGCWSGGGSSRENHLSWSWRSHSFSSGEKSSLSLPSADAMRRSHRLSQRSARSPADKGWGSLPAADATRPLK